MIQAHTFKKAAHCIGMANEYADHKQWLAAARYLEAAEKLTDGEPEREMLRVRRQQYLFSAEVKP